MADGVLNMDDLVGRVMSKCMVTNDGSNKMSVTLLSESEENTYQAQMSFHIYLGNSTCDESGLSGLIQMNPTVVYEESPSEGMFYVHDISGDTKFTPKVDSLVTWLNGATECGFSDWAIGTPKTITGINCTNFGQQEASGILGYGTIWLSLNDEGKVVFQADKGDDDHPGTTPENRSTTPDDEMLLVEE